MTHDYTLERCDAYALGMLSFEDRTLVEEHLRFCASCSRAIGESERVVCAMIEMTTPPYKAPGRLQERIEQIADPPIKTTALRQRRISFSWGALAAAVALSLGVSTANLWHENLALRSIDLRNDTVLATISTSHFKHVSLISRVSDLPAAKVLYAPDRSWLYLVVDAAHCDCHLVAQYGEEVRDLGSPQTNDRTSTLFIRDNGKPTSLRLVSSSGAVLAAADLQ